MSITKSHRQNHAQKRDMTVNRRPRRSSRPVERKALKPLNTEKKNKTGEQGVEHQAAGMDACHGPD